MPAHLLHQALFTNPRIAIEISDATGRIVDTNAAYRRLVDYDEAQLARLTVADLSHPDDRQREQEKREQLLAGHCEHLTFRKRYLTRSGKVFWADTTITAVRDDDGRGTCVALLVDATDAHRQELLQQGRAQVLELLYRHRPLEEVCNAIVASIEAVEQGLLCSILRLNATTGRLHKLAAPNLPAFYNEAIEGMKIGAGVGSCGAAAYFGRRVIVADILHHPYWQRARRLVEKTPLRSCWSQPIFDSDGRVLGTFAIYYTEPREPGSFELELIDSAADLTALAINHTLAQTALEKRDQLKNEFISTAAHELNTPLASIMGYVDLLRHMHEIGTVPQEKGLEYYGVIGDKVAVLSRIVNDLLDISKIEGGYRLSLERQPSDLRRMLRGVIGHFEQHASRHRFSLTIDEGVPQQICIDEGRIVQVLENLVDNAVKYSPDGGPVELQVSERSGELRIAVIDRGIGMDDDQLGRIFEKFYRANSGDTSIRGLGLGMSIVREIIEAHDGDIKVESAPGEGTTVRVSLPINPA